jgi:DNA-binding XRE family transcriptional regulator
MTGKELKAFREVLSLTQQELADILHVQRVTIARAETGKYLKDQEPNPDKEVSRLLQALLDWALRAGKFSRNISERSNVDRAS